MTKNIPSISEFRWYAVQTLSNQEAKVKRYLDKFIDIEKMRPFIEEVLMPSENVTEVKNGRKIKLYGEDKKILQEPWAFVRGTEGIINFVGGDHPVALKPDEIDRILNQVKSTEGKVVPKVQYEVGELVKITNGPFINLTGTIDAIDPDKGKLRVSVSIFGRFTPIELEYWQIERTTS